MRRVLLLTALAAPAAGVAEDRLPSSKIFRDDVAGIFARKCLECHDAANRQGGLDLSRGEHARAGGDSGTAFVAGDSGNSDLWHRIESGDMPAGRPPLTDAEKAAVRRWIDAGAEWPVEVIDPLLYKHERAGARVTLRRLTRPEYVETVRRTVGVDLSEDAGRLLPADVRADGFSNTAYNLNVDFAHVEAYARLAEAAASRMDAAKFARRFTKKRDHTDDTMKPLVEKIGRVLLRGPVDKRERSVFRGIAADVAASGGGFDEAVRRIVEAMLQSPRFLYRVERPRQPGEPVSDHELASRLGYAVWGGPPDAALAELADKGELSKPKVLRREVRRMLTDRRAVEQSRRFVGEWLNLRRLGSLRPGEEHYPDWRPELAADMRAETLDFAEEVLWNRRRPMAALLNEDVTFVTPRLATHYGLDVGGEKTTPVRLDLSDEPHRGGLLTQGSVLTVGGDEASMVARGLFVLHDVLRGTVNDPPPSVDTTPVPSRPGQSQRMVSEGRLADSSCAGCHTRFEPLAFALEKFDGVGRFADRDRHGNALREDGALLVPGAESSKEFASVAELSDMLAESDRVQRSLTWKLVQFLMGHPLGAGDAAAVEAIHDAAAKNGGTYQATVEAIALSDLFRGIEHED